jgi:hypothetical protein
LLREELFHRFNGKNGLCGILRCAVGNNAFQQINDRCPNQLKGCCRLKQSHRTVRNLATNTTPLYSTLLPSLSACMENSCCWYTHYLLQLSKYLYLLMLFQSLPLHLVVPCFHDCPMLFKGQL